VGQSFGFASELPLGPELAHLPGNHREFRTNPRRPEGRDWAESSRIFKRDLQTRSSNTIFKRGYRTNQAAFTPATVQHGNQGAIQRTIECSIAIRFPATNA
jgi:hypothetical protein